MNKLYQNETEAFGLNKIVAGADEAGRGPLAGPLVAAAVVLDRSIIIEGVNDSKKISEKKREALFEEIMNKALAYSIEIVAPKEIDEVNILNASLNGMQRAIEKLSIAPEHCLIDGNKLPRTLNISKEAVVKGDSHYASIAAASILAKVTRDRIMIELDKEFPEYGFARHKGYPTQKHLDAIKKYGVTKHHRMSYGPCAQLTVDFY